MASGSGTGLPFIAEGALTRGMAVMAGTAYPQVKVTSGANVKIVGYCVNDAADGQEVAVHPVTDGSAKVKAIAGATIARGAMLMAEGADGRLKTLAAAATIQYGGGIAREVGADGQLIDILPCFFAAVTT
jgi:hypothetical protein